MRRALEGHAAGVVLTSANRIMRRFTMTVGGKKLTTRDLETLHHAVTMRRRFDAGIFPRTIGDLSHYRRLERLGLIEFEGYGRDIDRSVERDVPVYRLTETGEYAAGVGMT